MPFMRTLLISAFLAVVGAFAPVQAREMSGVHPAIIQHGKASIYADKFHGRRTASGEVLDQNALTGASKSLPLGTHVVVTNLETGKSVRVRINDRGPHVKGHIIDLSKRAAEALDFGEREGSVRVKVEARPAYQPTAELSDKIREAGAR